MTKVNINNLKQLPLGDYEDNVVYSKFTLHESYFKIIEPAGEAFEKYIEKKLNPQTDDFLNDAIDDDEILEEDVAEYEWEKEWRESKNFSTGFKANKEENYYTMLGLEKDFMNTPQDEIRKAYKKYALVHHPDKKETNTEEERAEANKAWLKFKDAYETLTDPDRKLKYDSTFKFDDVIPSTDIKIKSDKDFFKKFGPVFIKNSIWSTRKPVPKIGDMNTDIKKVKKFYNFWFAFSSWRDFEIEGEHNLDEAENRWEKRQMLKENKKLKAQMVKDEKARIRTLADLAYKNDPRIIAEEKLIEEEKEKARVERELIRERIKKENEERERKIQEEYEEKKKRDAEAKILLKKNKLQELFDIVKNILNIEITKDEIWQVELNANADNLVLIVNELNNVEDKIEKEKLYKTLSSKLFGLKFIDNTLESSIWTKEEVNNLQKAVKKYPAGTLSRYEKINDMVKTKGMNQVITMTRYIATNPSLKFNGDTVDLKVLLYGDTKKPEKAESSKELIKNTTKPTEEKNPEDWSDIQQKALEAALKRYPGSLPANERWTKIASDVPDKNKKQCVERFKYISNVLKTKK